MVLQLEREVEAPHLHAALIAWGIVALLLIVGRLVAIDLEEHTLRTTAWRLFPLKTQGLVFQQAAARAKSVLPLYGSSELLNPWADRAGDFFRTAPTGFRVSPVGNVGATSLTILQKVGAVGRGLSGKKVAISISPAWFLFKQVRPDWYAGNFSLEEVSALCFGDSLDFPLKHAIAARLLQFPQPLDKSPLLEFAVARLAADRWSDRAIFYALWPMGKIQNAVFDLQDHFEAVAYLAEQKKFGPRPHRQGLNWPRLIARVDLRKIAAQKHDQKKRGADDPRVRRVRDKLFVDRINAAPEWNDLDLLLRALTKVHARPLLLSMPLDGHFYDASGVTRAAREAYYKRIRAVAQRYNFPLVEFEEDDDDPLFLDRQHTHLTAKGWLFYNRVLDDFFHGRALRI